MFVAPRRSHRSFPLLRFPDAYAVDADPPTEDGAVEDDAEELDPCLWRRGGATVGDADLPIPGGAAAVGTEEPVDGEPFRGVVVADTGVVVTRRLFGAIKLSWGYWLGRSGGVPSPADTSDGLGAVEPPPRDSLDGEADAPLETPTCAR